MKRLLISVVCMAVLFTGIAVCQEHERAATPGGKTPKLEKAYLQEVLDAWATLDPKNAAKYYGKGKDHVFYDVAPLKYQGWAEYEKGAAEVLKGFKSMKWTLNDDLQIHPEGNIAWSTATLNFTITDQAGKTMTMPARWTAIWHNHGANWVIAHEHVSVPMPDEPKKK